MRTGENFTARSRGYSPSRFAGPVWRQAQAKSACHDDNIVRVDSSNCSNVPPHYDPTGSLLRSTRQDGLQRPEALGGEWDLGRKTSPRNHRGSCSGYGAPPRRTDLGEVSVVRTTPRPDCLLAVWMICPDTTPDVTAVDSRAHPQRRGGRSRWTGDVESASRYVSRLIHH